MSKIITICHVCKGEIPQETLSPSHRGRKSSICKLCGKNKGRKRYKENHEKRAYHKKYYAENSERLKEGVRLNQVNNPEKKREYRRRPEVKIRRAQARRVKRALSRAGLEKKYSTLDYIGCTAPELKTHLESQWTEGMNWDNYGLEGWHIDHIRPLKSFDLSDEEQQRVCFHYSNLQPLWAKDNLEKGCDW